MPKHAMIVMAVTATATMRTGTIVAVHAAAVHAPAAVMDLTATTAVILVC